MQETPPPIDGWVEGLPSTTRTLIGVAVALGCRSTSDIRAILDPFDAATVVEAIEGSPILGPQGDRLKDGVIAALSASAEEREHFQDRLRSFLPRLDREGDDARIIRAVRYLPADDPTVALMLKYAFEVIAREPDDVLAAARHAANGHADGPCPPVLFLLATSLLQQDGIRSASTVLDGLSSRSTAIAQPCGHVLSEDDYRIADLLFLQRGIREPFGVEPTTPRPSPRPGSSPGRRRVTLLREEAVTQCQMGDLRRAREAILELRDVVASTHAPNGPSTVAALEAYSSVLAGNLNRARTFAQAVCEDQEDPDPHALALAGTALAWIHGMTRSGHDSGHRPTRRPMLVKSLNVLDIMERRGVPAAMNAAARNWATTPGWASAARKIHLSTMADLAWVSSDMATVQWCLRELAKEGMGAEAAVVQCQLSSGRSRADTDLALAARGLTRSVLPFADVRLKSVSVDNLWMQGRRAEANSRLRELVEFADRRQANHHVWAMLLRHPEWVDELRRRPETPLSAPWLPDATHLVGVGQVDHGPLTVAEHRVLDVLARGTTAVEVASVLGVSPHTVRTQIKAIYRKLGVHRRSDAIAAARMQGLIGRVVA